MIETDRNSRSETFRRSTINVIITAIILNKNYKYFKPFKLADHNRCTTKRTFHSCYVFKNSMEFYIKHAIKTPKLCFGFSDNYLPFVFYTQEFTRPRKEYKTAFFKIGLKYGQSNFFFYLNTS